MVLGTEGYQSSGSSNITVRDITVPDDTPQEPVEPTPEPIPEPQPTTIAPIINTILLE